MSPLPSALSTQPREAERLTCVVDEFDRVQFPPRDRWLRVLEQSRNSRVYHHPDYARVAIPDLGTPGWTVTCFQDERPVGMLILIPKRCRHGRQVLPGAVSSQVGVRLAGFGVLGSEAPHVVDALVRALADEVVYRRIPCVEFEELQEASPLWASLQTLQSEGFRFAPEDAFDAHYHIRLPGSPEEFWGTFKSKQRYNLRKEKEGLGDYGVRCFRDAGDVDEWLCQAHEISQKSWQSHQLGLRIRNDDAEREFLTFLATIGAWRSYILTRQGAATAFVMGHQWNGTFCYDEVGFDRHLVNLSPGKVLLQEIISDLLTCDRPAVFDFGLGAADYKSFLSNDRTRSATLCMFAPGFRSTWQVSSMRLQKTLVRTARRLLERTGWYETLRRRLRDTAVD